MSRKFLGRMLKDERGAVSLWFVVALPAILAVVALAVDMSYAYFTRGKLHNTASTAALAAATQLVSEPADAAAEAAMRIRVRDEAAIYAEEISTGLGLSGVHLDENVDVEIGNWDETLPEGDEFVLNGAPFTAVRVTTRRAGGDALDLLIATGGLTQAAVNTSAVATNIGGDVVGPVCMLVLSPDEDNALEFNGSIDVNSNECGICVNSNDPLALTGNGESGDVDVDADAADNPDGASGFIWVNGGMWKEPGADGITSFNPDPELGRPICENPFETPPPLFDDRFTNDDCSLSVDPVEDTATNTWTFPAGVHCAFGNPPNTIKIAADSTIVFETGIHHFIGEIPGDPMEFSTKGSGPPSGAVSTQDPGATLLLSNTQLDLGGTKDYDMTANPNEGENFLFYQNPADDTLNVTHKFAGNLDDSFFGKQYFGHQGVEYKGNVGNADANDDGCTLIIAETVLFAGGGYSQHNLDTSGCDDDDPPVAISELILRLVD